jgi:hypothetical protein
MGEFTASHCSDALYQGTTLVVPHTIDNTSGFSPWVFEAMRNGNE